MVLAGILHPALWRLPSERRADLLRKARRTPLDLVELVGIAAALIVAIVLARGGVGTLGTAAASMEGSTAESITAGLGVGSILIALFLMRRTQRGLRRLLGTGRA